MRTILIMLWAIQLGGALKFINAPSDLSASIPYFTQFLTVLGWLALFSWGIITYPFNKSRAFWLICGFIVYSLLRLVLFAVTDYDHQRRTFLILTALVVSGVLLLYGAYVHQKQQTKENFTNDRQ